MGWTVLHTAARDGDMKRIKRCIEDVKWLDKIDVNSQSADCPDLFCSFCVCFSTDLPCKSFSCFDGDIFWMTAEQRGHTALHMCAANGHVEAMQV